MTKDGKAEGGGGQQMCSIFLTFLLLLAHDGGDLFPIVLHLGAALVIFRFLYGDGGLC